MKKNNVRIKDNITLTDKINAINGIISCYFTDGEYTPYYSEMAETIAIVNYFLEGLEFDKNEDVYTSVISDIEVMELIYMFNADRTNERKVIDFVRANVKDKVDFIKQRIIHSHDDMNKIIKACDVIIDALENFSKLNLSELSEEDIKNASSIMMKIASGEITADNLSNALKEAVGFKMDEVMSEILDAKNAEIKELKKYKTLWEGRNATSDKVVPMKG